MDAIGGIYRAAYIAGGDVFQHFNVAAISINFHLGTTRAYQPEGRANLGLSILGIHITGSLYRARPDQGASSQNEAVPHGLGVGNRLARCPLDENLSILGLEV